MASEKDRMGEKLHEKERAEEDRYFQQKDEELLDRLRRQKTAEAAPAPGRCPKDGTALQAVELVGVRVEECPTCHGMWLEAGELEVIAERERDSWLGKLFYSPKR
jgi:hypothetical protein